MPKYGKAVGPEGKSELAYQPGTYFSSWAALVAGSADDLQTMKLPLEEKIPYSLHAKSIVEKAVTRHTQEERIGKAAAHGDGHDFSAEKAQ